jgi:tRNA(fMet)-specific endonuclease VapC
VKVADVYLLDTNIASAAWDHGHRWYAEAQTFLRNLKHDDVIVISVVTLGEIEYGLRLWQNADEDRKALVRNAMRAFALPRQISRHTAEHFAILRAALFMQYADRYARERIRQKRPEDLLDGTTGKSLGIQENDIWLAAQAREWNAVLVTDDRMDHIRRLDLDPPLRLQEWR